MTVRRGRGEQARRLLLAFACVVFTSGCVTAPSTYFDWGTKSAAARRAAHVTAKHVAAKPKPQGVCSSTPVPQPRPSPVVLSTQNSEANPVVVASAGPAGNGRFMWPVQGRVIADFGAAAGGERNDGINIAVSDGEPIRAAADGVVTYSGNELKNYGNLALIKHDGDYVTAYAHADRFVVERGDHVAKGQVIGYAGSTGDVTSPQLHFEIRRGTHGEKPVNPRPLLGPLQVASK